MKIPVIRQFYQNSNAGDLEATLNVLEAYCEFRGVTEHEVDLAGELITNICGALEVHASVASGVLEKDALNAFGQKVMSSIDR